MSKIYDELKDAEQARRSSQIRPGLRVNGEISGNEDLLVEGSVNGPVNLGDGVLTVGDTGNVKGDVTAREVIVLGSVTGNIEARDRVEIRPSGSITGDIVTSRIVIDDGARCKGAIEVGRGAQAGATLAASASS